MHLTLVIVRTRGTGTQAGVRGPFCSSARSCFRWCLIGFIHILYLPVLLHKVTGHILLLPEPTSNNRRTSVRMFSRQRFSTALRKKEDDNLSWLLGHSSPSEGHGAHFSYLAEFCYINIRGMYGRVCAPVDLASLPPRRRRADSRMVASPRNDEGPARLEK